MWTTYSGHLYRQEEQMKRDIEMWEKENAMTDDEWEKKRRYDIENGLMDDPLPWEEEDENIKRQFKRDGYYSVPLDGELEELIDSVYPNNLKEAK